jgi:hypothetical protein
VVADVEAEQIIAQQTFQQLLFPRKNTEGFRVRPRDVPELRHRQFVPAHGLDHFGQQAEMVVLDEHDGRFAGGLFDDRAGEDFVDFLVPLPVRRVEFWRSKRNVAQRPQPFIRQAVVVALLLFLGQPDQSQVVCVLPWRHPYMTAGVHHGAVCVAGAVADPDAAAGPDHGVKRGGHAAGGGDDFDAPLLVPVQIRRAVGDNNEFVTFEPVGNQLMQGLACPHEVFLPRVWHARFAGWMPRFPVRSHIKIRGCRSEVKQSGERRLPSHCTKSSLLSEGWVVGTRLDVVPGIGRRLGRLPGMGCNSFAWRASTSRCPAMTDNGLCRWRPDHPLDLLAPEVAQHPWCCRCTLHQAIHLMEKLISRQFSLLKGV